MDLGLRDKVVVVTGASRGIGKETCVLFAKECAKVACVDVNGDGAQAVAAATPCCPAPVSATTRRLPIRTASSACPKALLILWAPVWARSSRLR